MAKKLKIYNGASWEDVTFAITPPNTAVTNAFTTNQVIDASTSVAALRVTQRGAGEAFRVEDDTNPDSTPFIINSAGNVGVGTTSLTAATGYASITMDGVNGTLWSAKVNGTETFRIQPTSLATTINQITNLPILFNTNNTERMRIDASGNVQFANQIVSNVATGTAPFAVASTTVVTNLNAAQVAGVPGANLIYGINSSGSQQSSGTQNLQEIAHYKSGFWEIAPGSGWAPTADWYWGTTLAHTSNSPSYNYSAQIAVQNSNKNGIYVRTISNGVAQSWSKILTENAATITGAQTISAWQVRNTYASTSTPSGGNDGDMWATYV